MEDYKEDCKQLLSQIKEHDKLLRLKRRWLMDLDLSERELKLSKNFNPLKDKNIPEILLREDDVYYDTVRYFVQRGFGVYNFVKEHQDQENEQSFDSHYILKNLSQMLDGMTNKGLYCFAELLTDGSLEFEKTRWKMKKIIKEYLPTFLNKESHISQMRMRQCSRLLRDPQYFHRSHDVSCASTEYRIAAGKVLDGLEKLPLETLSAMYRKLKGEIRCIPELGSYKSCQKRDFIDPVRKCCMNMLSELHDGEEPQEPLVKALAVAGLTLKLILGHPSVPEFRKFSPQIESLQNGIAKAVCLINSGNKVSIADIEALHKKLHRLSDSKVQFSKRNLRSAVRNLLTDFLFECGDMESIPECLMEAVNDINKRFQDSTCRISLKEEVEEEVEFLLCISAQTKQIVWDLLPGQEIDEDFSTAYLEDLDERDDAEDEEAVDLPQNCKLCYDHSRGLSESIDETNPFGFGSPTSGGNGDNISSRLSANSQLNSKLESVHITEGDTSEPYDFVHYSSCQQSKMWNNTQSFNGNEQQLASVEKHEQTYLHAFSSTVNQNGSSSPLSPGGIKCEHDVKTYETLNDSGRNAECTGCNSPSRETGTLQHKQCKSGNKYLSIQRACDETSMAMYRIIGSMLDEFAQAQQLDLSHDYLSYLRSHTSVPNDSKGFSMKIT
ncbi:hypothetical protein ACH5RR_032177 [Cinchona calisaya]|uniref:Uncharacterized protein n=1 Tax=Cinchona calisaya TaxID=153742 RepID=A0ABD2YHD1_9GENT